MSSEILKLTNEELDVLKTSEEAYLLFYNKFKTLSTERRDELLDAGFDILMNGLHIDAASAAIIQQLLNFRLTLLSFNNSTVLEKLYTDEIQFIIKLVIEKHRQDVARGYEDTDN